MSVSKSVETIKKIMEYTESGQSLMWDGVISLNDSDGVLSILKNTDVSQFSKEDAQDIFRFMSSHSHMALIKTPDITDQYKFNEIIKELTKNKHVVSLIEDNHANKSKSLLIDNSLKNSSEEVMNKIKSNNSSEKTIDKDTDDDCAP